MIEVYKPKKTEDIPVYELYKYVGVYNKLQNLISKDIASYITSHNKDYVRILDLGVGSCNSIEYILDNLDESSKKLPKIYYTGVDINKENLSFCEEKFENKILLEAGNRGIKLEYKLVSSDITKDLDKKLNEKSYDIILLISVLEFLGNDWKKALDNAYNLLKEGGRMYIAIPYRIPMFLRKLWTTYVGIKTILKEKIKGNSEFPLSYAIKKMKEAKNLIKEFNKINKKDVINYIKDRAKNIEVKTIRPYMDIIIIEK